MSRLSVWGAAAILLSSCDGLLIVDPIAGPVDASTAAGSASTSTSNASTSTSTSTSNSTSNTSASTPTSSGDAAAPDAPADASTDCAADGACAAPSVVTQVSAGFATACALSADGSVWCWGGAPNAQTGCVGVCQVGAGPQGFTTAVRSLAVGFTSSCALMEGGAVECWGDNTYGQLGNGTQAPGIAPPGPVTGLTSGVTSLSVGEDWACAVTATGGVVCWGKNLSPTPMPVAGLTSGVTSVSVGATSACAITTSGALMCWGASDLGALGDGDDATASSGPVQVVGLASGVTSVSVGRSFACAVTSPGAVQCWGKATQGQLGNDADVPATLESSVPVPVLGLTSGVISVSAGAATACALTAAGGVECWGSSVDGVLGNGMACPVDASAADASCSGADSPIPVQVTGLDRGVSAITVGGSWEFGVGGSACALTAAGSVLCWGFEVTGDLGSNSSTFPVPVTGL